MGVEGGSYSEPNSAVRVIFHYRRWHPMSGSSWRPHQLVLADWLLTAYLLCRPRGSEADAPVKTGTKAKAINPAPAVSSNCSNLRSHPVLFFPSNPYSQLIPFLEPLRREPSFILMEWDTRRPGSICQLPLFTTETKALVASIHIHATVQLFWN